ncbi:MAG TPA: biotin carboxylase N-terminal domain-containing protein [Xanthobacteraceae bacterium]|nr:biotin carboxylase N-terminal domain-containing protein [Xanthobacteraceae bacterium]
MFESVLIANRGEIACRIARTAKALGMRTIGIYSDADRDGLHPRLCDEAHHVGPAPARESYLAGERLIEVAKRTGAQCIHPGYGFLSENPDFAEACMAAGIVFIGPPPAAIRTMGFKDQAKTLVEKHGVPVVPGYQGERQDPKFLKETAYQIGYPVLIKAVAGGGGKGMRRVDKHAEFESALEAAIREAQAAFGDGRMLVEKYITAPRHIEIQVFADRHGNVIHLFERDCSMQRRHQKVIEESPAPGMTSAVRQAMGQAAIEVARAVGYAGAGTVEFIAASATGLKPDGFWFVEMNTRLQVEHPVTEAVTGLDLVAWQFRIAAGEPLPLRQDQVALTGHAVEARIYAEDPEHGFLPSSGRIVALEFPTVGGLRVDCGVEAAATVTSHYDPLIAKIIAQAPTRVEALERLAAALAETIILGPRSNVGFLVELCRAPGFRDGNFDTGFIDRNLAALGAAPQALDRGAAAAGVSRLLATHQARVAALARLASDETHSPWAATDAFQLATPRELVLPVIVNGEDVNACVSYDGEAIMVSIEDTRAAEDAIAVEDEHGVYLLRGGRQSVVRAKDFDAVDIDLLLGDGVIVAPMHGKVLAVLVEVGAHVTRGQQLAVIEAMKMEHSLRAPIEGTVGEITVTAGRQIAEGARLMVIEPAVGFS